MNEAVQTNKDNVVAKSERLFTENPDVMDMNVLGTAFDPLDYDDFFNLDTVFELGTDGKPFDTPNPGSYPENTQYN